MSICRSRRGCISSSAAPGVGSMRPSAAIRVAQSVLCIAARVGSPRLSASTAVARSVHLPLAALLDQFIRPDAWARAFIRF